MIVPLESQGCAPVVDSAGRSNNTRSCTTSSCALSINSLTNSGKFLIAPVKGAALVTLCFPSVFKCTNFERLLFDGPQHDEADRHHRVQVAVCLILSSLTQHGRHGKAYRNST